MVFVAFLHVCGVESARIRSHAFNIAILRRCGKYQWRSKPNEEECEILRTDADSAAPKAGYAGNFTEAIGTWHKRAEAVLVSAENLLLSANAIKAERSKGSMPTVRRIAEKMPGDPKTP